MRQAILTFVLLGALAGALQAQPSNGYVIFAEVGVLVFW